MDLGSLEPIVWGAAGDLRQKAPSDWPEWTRLKSYWAITAAMIVAGAGLVILHQRSGANFQNNAWLALNIGASAPLLLRQLSAGPSTPSGPTNPSRVN